MIAKKFVLLTLSAILLNVFHSIAQQINELQDLNPQWSQPYQPFRIAGNLYYVGTYDLACYLIATQPGS